MNCFQKELRARLDEERCFSSLTDARIKYINKNSLYNNMILTGAYMYA
jgi:hypothetical protein